MQPVNSIDLGLPDNKCFVIGEVAQAHDGSLGTAHAYIDAIAEAGADAVKFQTHIAAAESTLDEPWRVRFSRQDATRFDYWKRMEFSVEQWAGLVQHAREKKLMFLSSPFSVNAVDLLNDLGVPLWKPLLISSGMSTLGDIDNVVSGCRSRHIPFGLFQCSSAYPCAPEQWGLRLMEILRERYRCPVGLSDHSGGIYAGLAAATLRADFIEVHVTFDRGMFGPDVPASITVEELKKLVEGIRLIARSLQTGVDKDQLAEQTSPLKKIFGRSLALKTDLSGGTVLAREHLTLKKPGGGIPYTELEALIGSTLRRDKSANRLLRKEDLE
ncbi:MAG: N-acetylneuraminate synthase family protein [Exilibacterium sp.]